MSIDIIKGIIAETSGYGDKDDVTEDLTFFDDLNMDEDSYYDMLGTIEDTFGIEFDEDAPEFKVVNDLISYVSEEIKELDEDA